MQGNRKEEGDQKVEQVDQGRKVDALKETGIQCHQKVDHMEDHLEEVPIWLSTEGGKSGLGRGSSMHSSVWGHRCIR